MNIYLNIYESIMRALNIQINIKKYAWIFKKIEYSTFWISILWKKIQKMSWIFMIFMNIHDIQVGTIPRCSKRLQCPTTKSTVQILMCGHPVLLSKVLTSYGAKGTKNALPICLPTNEFSLKAERPRTITPMSLFKGRGPVETESKK